MSTKNNLTFDENKYQIKSRVILGQFEVPKMTKFLIQKGIVKSEKTAHTLMLVAVGTFFSLSIFIIYISFFKQLPVPETISEEELFIQEETNNQI